MDFQVQLLKSEQKVITFKVQLIVKLVKLVKLVLQPFKFQKLSLNLKL